jgi:sensor histidine kinase YesM
MTKIQSKIKDFFINLSQVRILQHLLFWAVSFIVLLYFFNTSNKIEKIDIIYTAIFHVSLVTGVYLNLLVLIPLFLKKDRYLFYGLVLLALIAGTAEFNLLTFNKLIDYVLPGYYFISYYEFNDILIFVIVYTGLTTLLKLSKSWFLLMEADRKLMRAEKEKINNELLALRSQINPHFLFNSLNSIYSLALNKSGNTPAAILKISDLMRYMLYEANEDKVPLKNELHFLESYFELQKLRSDDKAEIKLNITGAIKEQQIAPLLFLPFIENSFKHGVKGDPEGGFTRVSINVTDKEVQLDVINNKGKIDKVEKGDFQGIGLQNARRRLELLYPQAHVLSINDLDDSFEVKLKIVLS